MLRLSDTTSTAVFPIDTQILLWTSPKKNLLKLTLSAAQKKKKKINKVVSKIRMFLSYNTKVEVVTEAEARVGLNIPT